MTNNQQAKAEYPAHGFLKRTRMAISGEVRQVDELNQEFDLLLIELSKYRQLCGEMAAVLEDLIVADCNVDNPEGGFLPLRDYKAIREALQQFNDLEKKESKIDAT